MKNFLAAILVIPFLLLPGEAPASNKDLARQLIELTTTKEETVAPPRPSLDPKEREAHFRSFAEGFYAKKLSEKQLVDILAFFRSSAGQRLVKTEDTIEVEVMMVAFSEVITPPAGGSAAPASDPAEKVPDVREELALELMKARFFDHMIQGHAAQYDRIRGTTGASDARGGKSSADHIRQLFIDRYSKQFGKGFLVSLVEFFSSDLGVKYARLREELQEELLAESKRYDRKG